MNADQSSDLVKPSLGQWARDIADTYRQMADDSKWEQQRAALRNEAAKYYIIANRMDRIIRDGGVQ